MYVSGSICLIFSWGHSSILCSAPSGQGILQSVQVVSRMGLQSLSNASFNYNAPVVSTISPPTLYTGGGSRVITIAGFNFGREATVAVQGSNCPVQSQSDAQIVCNAPGTSPVYGF